MLEGELEIQIEDTRHRAPAGATVFVPKGVPHTFRNPGPGPSKALALLTPAGLEAFFVDVEGLLSEGEPDMDAVIQTAAKYGLEVVGPPLGDA